MAARFWVGGAGTWDGTTTTHWASSSGGAGGASAPTSADAVTFDANSGLSGVTVTIAATAACASASIAGPASKTCVFSLSGNPSFSGAALTITGNSAVNRVLVQSNVVGTARTIALGAAGSITPTNVDFMDIAVTGTNTPVSGTSLGDAQGNSGITFTTSATQTWSGNTTGNWDVAANWTSRVPLPQDDVVISGLTSGTITANQPRSGRSVDFTGSTGGTFTASVAQTYYGSFTFVAGVTLTASSSGYVFAGRNGSFTISNRNKSMVSGAQTVTINAPGSTYSLTSTLATGGILQVTNGTLDGNGQNGQATALITASGGRLRLGSGTWTLNTSSGNALSLAAGTLTAGTSTIVLSDTGSLAKTFPGAGNAFWNLTITPGGTGAVTISGSNSFNSLTCTGPKSIVLTAGTTQTVASLSLNGTAGNLVTITSSTAGTQATISCPSGTVSCDFLSLKDNQATGGASFYAGANSTNVSGNAGWKFTAVPTDTPSGSLLAVGVQTDAKRYGDTSTGALTAAGARTEAKGTADSPSGALTSAGSAVDAKVARDSSSATLTVTTALLESRSSADAAAGALTATAALVEGKRIADGPSSTMTFAAALTDAARGSDTPGGTIAFAPALTVAMRGQDAPAGTLSVSATSSEVWGGVDAAAGSVTPTGANVTARILSDPPAGLGALTGDARDQLTASIEPIARFVLSGDSTAVFAWVSAPSGSFAIFGTVVSVVEIEGGVTGQIAGASSGLTTGPISGVIELGGRA